MAVTRPGVNSLRGVDRPIGMFDSGFGGLTVARALIDLLPAEDLVYIGDTGRYPYGPQPQAEVRGYARELAWSLVKDHDVKAVDRRLQHGGRGRRSTSCAAELPVPVHRRRSSPARGRSCRRPRTGRVGVIGTVGTVVVGRLRARRRGAPAPPVDADVAACPGFVEFVERGQTTGDEVTVLAERLLAPVVDAEVDALLLGCTHYPFLARVISDVMGPDVTLVSSADETAFAVLARRSASSACCARPAATAGATASCRAATSRWFAELGGRLLGPELAAAERWTAGDPDRIAATDSRPRGHRPCPAPTDAPPTSCARSRFERDYTEMAAGSCSSRSAAPGCCAPRRSTRTCRAGCAASGKGWVTAEYSMLPGSSPERVDREAAKGKQSGRTVEIQRLIGRVAARRVRHAAARRAPGRRRLRRAAGRRRHPHGEHLRRLPRAARRARRGVVQRGAISRPPAALVLRGDQRRHRRRHAGARPALRRGPHGRGRHERRDAAPGRRRRGRASSRCRAPPRAWRSAAASSTRCSAWPSGGLRRDHRRCRPRWSPSAAGARPRATQRR